jgi:predicted DNA-binding antitoxin AbrB/MazE fold protein
MLSWGGCRTLAKIVEAVYERGVLKPLERLNLREGQRVRIKIIEKDVIQLAREIRRKLEKQLEGRDLVEELSRERERFG